MGEHFKVDILAEIPTSEAISGYHQGDFYDLCRGPHIPRTGKAGAFKLTHVAGAYWKGDEKNPMLSRIYGTAFHTAKELEEHLALIEEAKRRDHRKLGKELDLFLSTPKLQLRPSSIQKALRSITNSLNTCANCTSNTVIKKSSRHRFSIRIFGERRVTWITIRTICISPKRKSEILR